MTEAADLLDAILLCGVPASQADELAVELGLDALVVTAANAGEARAVLDRQEVAVLCLGEQIAGAEAEGFLRAALEARPESRFSTVVLAAGPKPELFEDLIADDRIYYLTQETPPLPDVARILRSAIARFRDNRSASQAGDERSALDSLRALELRRDLGKATFEQVPVLVAGAVENLLEVDGACCLIYDARDDTLWTRRSGNAEGQRESAAAGVVSFVVRTGTSVVLESLGEDSRYDPEADNDGGLAEDRLLAVPVAVTVPRRRVLGVLVALRRPSRPPFSDEDRDRLQLLADQIAPTLEGFVLEAGLDDEAARRYGALGSPATDVFRQEALEHHASGSDSKGHLLQISPAWTRWAFRLLILVFLASALYITLGSVNEYATGVAVVRVEGRTDVTATTAGTVSAIEVAPGQSVAAGALLVRLYGAQETADLERTRHEFELGLLSRLRNPADAAVERTLGALRAQKHLAEARLEERSVRAPHAGAVSDVRVRSGQHLSPGDVVLSLRGGDSELSVIALLPGHYRPLIRVGLPMRLELQGYRYAYQQLVVESVSDEVLGPAEARRLLGPGVGETLPVDGPVLLVTARLPSPTFESDGRRYDYHDGIQGSVEIRVRSERMLTVLLPGLKALVGDAG
jgi:membrane fusion protein (multidrug efflux system)